MANQGTLFLDEVGEMSLTLQAKILRAIETQKIRRIGSTKEIDTDFRLICSTNTNLEEAMEKKTFRSDLFYRISPFIINVPPLRKRIGDLPEFVRNFMTEAGFSTMEWDDDFINTLKAYRWPGNIRELRNVIDRAVLIGDGKVLRCEELSPHIIEKKLSVSEPPEYLTLAEVERLHIIRTVRSLDNKTKAAEVLGVSLKTLYNKLHAYTQGD